MSRTGTLECQSKELNSLFHLFADLATLGNVKNPSEIFNTCWYL